MCSQTSAATAHSSLEHGGTDPAYGEEVEGAIQAAFLSGTDDDFQELLEVRPCPVDWCARGLSDACCGCLKLQLLSFWKWGLQSGTHSDACSVCLSVA